MAMETVPALDPAREMLVIIMPYPLDFTEFHGTRMQLEAEGLIPAGTEWPQGYSYLYWQAGKLDYWLRRQRPPGAKGPRRAFADVDWFSLRIELTHKPSHAEREIARKVQELRDTIYRRSPKGESEWHAHYHRHLAAQSDAHFQQFKATVIGDVRKRRGRGTAVEERS